LLLLVVVVLLLLLFAMPLLVPTAPGVIQVSSASKGHTTRPVAHTKYLLLLLWSYVG
jgi:hypothetical protein